MALCPLVCQVQLPWLLSLHQHSHSNSHCSHSSLQMASIQDLWSPLVSWGCPYSRATCLVSTLELACLQFPQLPARTACTTVDLLDRMVQQDLISLSMTKNMEQIISKQMAAADAQIQSCMPEIQRQRGIQSSRCKTNKHSRDIGKLGLLQCKKRGTSGFMSCYSQSFVCENQRISSRHPVGTTFELHFMY